MYIYKNGIYRISVRNLVEFVLRSGDIDNRTGSDINKEEAMAKGNAIHRKIQKQMGAEYTPEVAMKTTYIEDDIEISVEGRADGVIERPEEVIIDEIKGVYANPEYFEDARALHKAQAMCYGYMYITQHNLDRIGIWVTYCDMETMLVRRFRYEYEKEVLISWFEDIMKRFVRWIKALNAHIKERNSSIKQLSFPFEYREGQRDVVVGVYRVINMKRNLFIEAPTGSGKTISTIFPSVMSMGEGLCDKIFYLTAKTITGNVAYETFELLKTTGLNFKVLVITAKEKACMCEKTECNPDKCAFAKGHYDRVNEACFDMVWNENIITRDIVNAYAIKHNVCPFELCLDASYWCDAIICDYNYVFDPNIYLKRFFSDGVKGEYVFLVDEAHNLVERARQMYSAELFKEEFLEIKRIMGEKDKVLSKYLNKCNKILLDMKKEQEKVKTYESIGEFTLALLRVFARIEKQKDVYKHFDCVEDITQFYFKIRHFLNMNELVDENYILYTEVVEDGRFMIKEFCVNPSSNLEERMSKGNSTIFFSATLLPIKYYKELLGSLEDYAIYANSIFDMKKRALLIAKDISSKYTRRNVAEYTRICDYIDKIANVKKGNYFAFFPSYRYMQQVFEIFVERYGEKYRCIMQSSNMSDIERNEFLSNFESPGNQSLIGFVVTGGVFSEGIDMKEDMLIGNIIVGTGLPQICTERELLRDFYNEENGCGYEYAYVYPGMNKVMQAAGRLIRTEEDEGVLALLDERFFQRQYQNIFPKEWKDYIGVTEESVGEKTKEFWDVRNL